MTKRENERAVTADQVKKIRHCPGLGLSMHIHESRDLTLSQ
jgi:hypothetical protein